MKPEIEKKSLDYLTSTLGQRYAGARFSNFSAETDLQRRAADQLAKWCASIPLQRELSVFVLTGGNGTGKTWLAAAAWWDMKERYWPEASPGLKFGNAGPLMVRDVDLHSYWRGSFDKDAERNVDGLYSDYMSRYLLIWDDLAKGKPSAGWNEFVFDLIDSRINQSYPMIITTNFTPNELAAQFDPATVDRLTSGLTLQMDGPTRRGRPIPVAGVQNS